MSDQIILPLLTAVLILFAITIKITMTVSVYEHSMLRWEQARFPFVYDIIQGVQALSHKATITDITRGPGGLLQMHGTNLNYETLKSMVFNFQGIEESRAKIFTELRKTLQAMGEWEFKHPKPYPPLTVRLIFHLPKEPRS